VNKRITALLLTTFIPSLPFESASHNHKDSQQRNYVCYLPLNFPFWNPGQYRIGAEKINTGICNLPPSTLIHVVRGPVIHDGVKDTHVSLPVSSHKRRVVRLCPRNRYPALSKNVTERLQPLSGPPLPANPQNGRGRIIDETCLCVKRHPLDNELPRKLCDVLPRYSA
jgi:hypothetical protein